MPPVGENDVVEAYRNLLNRDPEPGAVENNIAAHGNIWTMINAIVRSAEFNIPTVATHGLSVVEHGYLSKSMGIDDRKRAFLYHRKFIYGYFSTADLDKLLFGEGFRLGAFGQMQFCLRRSSYPHEGELDIVYLHDDIPRYSIGFSIIEGSIFDAGPGPIIFIARMQGLHPAKRLLDADRMVVSAQAATFSGLCGIKSSFGVENIVIVNAANQLSSIPDNVVRLQGVYDEFAVRKELLLHETSGKASRHLKNHPRISRAHRRRREIRQKMQSEIANSIEINLNYYRLTEQNSQYSGDAGARAPVTPRPAITSTLARPDIKARFKAGALRLAKDWIFGTH